MQPARRQRPALSLSPAPQLAERGQSAAHLLSPGELSSGDDKSPIEEGNYGVSYPRPAGSPQHTDHVAKPESLDKSRRRSKADRPVARGRHEGAKLLSHLLEKASAAVEEMQWYDAPLDLTGDDEDGDDGKEDEAVETILELVIQIRDVVIFGASQSWNLFFMDTERTNAFQLSPVAPNFAHGASPPASPGSQQSFSHGSASRDLFRSAVDLLERLTLLAINHRIDRFGPTAPPLALQSVSMDFAIALQRSVSPRPRELTLIGQAVVAGIEGWGAAMKAKLLGFFEVLLCDALGWLDKASKQQSGTSAPTIRINGDESRSQSERGMAGTYAAELPLLAHHLSALVAPALSGMLASHTPEQSTLLVVQCHHRLLESLIRAKLDLYNDLLEVIAYGTSAARNAALSVLTTYWPAAVGHHSIAPPPQRSRFQDDAWRVETGNAFLPPNKSEGTHEYMPWAITSSGSGGRITYCGDCKQPIEGFALICVTGCHAPLHVQCYNLDEGLFIQHYASSTGTRVAAARFSCISQSRRAVLLEDATASNTQRAQTSAALAIKQHALRLCNVFTLTVCFVCRKALWGVTRQAFRCGSCQQFAHRRCLLGKSVSSCQPQDALPVEQISVDWRTMREDWVKEHADLIFPDSQLAKLTQEELSITYSALWTHLQLFEAGVASGTIVLTGQDSTTDFELHALVVRYGEALSSMQLKRSAVLDDFVQVKGNDEASRILFSSDLLAHVSAHLRAPTQQEAGSTNRLAVTAEPDEPGSAPWTFESLRLSAMFESLKVSGVRSTAVARILVDWLVSTRRFCEPASGHAVIDYARDDTCVFLLPTLVDPLLTVETLIIAIEQMLQEPDLSIQEAGFLLLVRRCMPTPFASQYALGRLAKTILRWLISEEALFAAAVTQARRNRMEEVSGSAYLTARTGLLKSYAVKWMSALHDLDEGAYADALHAGLTALAMEVLPERIDSGVDVEQTHKWLFADSLFRYIAAMMQAGLLFTAFDSLLPAWLDECSQAAGLTQVRLSRCPFFEMADVTPSTAMRSLVRLFHPALAATQKPGRPTVDTAQASNEQASIAADAWKLVMSVVEADEPDLQRGLSWLRFLTISGVAIPPAQLRGILKAFTSAAPLFADTDTLSQILHACISLPNQERRALGETMAWLLRSQIEMLVDSEEGPQSAVQTAFVKRCLVSILIVAGAANEDLVYAQLLEDKDSVRSQVHKRRASASMDSLTELTLSASFVDGLGRLAQHGDPSIRGLVCRFLYVLLVRRNTFAGQEQLVFQSAESLANALYRFFEPSQTGLTSFRMPLLLRFLAIEPSAFARLIKRVSTVELWEARWTALDVFYQLALEAAEAAPTTTQSAHEQAIIHLSSVIMWLFEALWDGSASVRQKADTLIASLQSAQLVALASILQACFVAEDWSGKNDLVAFALQLRGRMPSWQILSWRTLTAALYEIDELRTSEKASVSIHVGLVSLGLAYVASGVSVEMRELQQIKYHAARAMGLEARIATTSKGSMAVEVIAVDRDVPDDIRFACLYDLKRLLDVPRTLAPRRTIMSSKSADEEPMPLVGLEVADLILRLIASDLDLSKLGYSHLRSLLDSLLIIVFKQDVALRPAVAELTVAAVRKVTDLLLVNAMAHEARLCILAIFSTLLRSHPAMSIPLLGPQISACLTLMARQSSEQGAEWMQVKLFLQAAILKYGASGLWIVVFSSKEDGLFEALKDVIADNSEATDELGRSHQLRDLPVLDVARSLLSGQNSPEVVSLSLSRLAQYTERCHSGPYAADVISAWAVFVGRFERLLSDWHGGHQVVDDTLKVSAVVLKHLAGGHRALEVSVDALLRSGLGRFPVTKDSLVALFISLGEVLLQKRPKEQGNIGATCLSFLMEGLAGRAVPVRNTTAFLQVLHDDLGTQRPLRFARVVLPEATSAGKLARRLVSFLLLPPGDQRLGRDGFEAWLGAAKLLLSLARRDTEAARAIEAVDGLNALRVINLLCIACLDATDHSMSRQLVDLLSSQLSDKLLGCMTIPVDGEAVAQLAAFVQLWSLLLRRAWRGAEGTADVEQAEAAMWHGGCWSVLETMLELAEPADDGSLNTVVWATFADLVLFLHLVGSSLVATEASTWSSWLQTLHLRPNDPSTTKHLRALQALQGEPLVPISAELLFKKARDDCYAAFKLASFNV